MKCPEGRIKKNIIANDNPFTEVKAHFSNVKFYLKSYVFTGEKSIDFKLIMFDKIISKKIDACVGKVEVDAKELYPVLNERKVTYSIKKLTTRLFYVPNVKKQKCQII